MNDVLISMNALKRFIQENGVVYSNKLDKFAVEDAIRVVRCKDCKHRDGTVGQPNILCYQMHDDDFCSYGERKETYDSM